MQRIQMDLDGGRLRLVRSRFVHALQLAGSMVIYGVLGCCLLLAGLAWLLLSPVLLPYFPNHPTSDASGPLHSGYVFLQTYGGAAMFILAAFSLFSRILWQARVVLFGDVYTLDREANALLHNRKVIAPLDQLVEVRLTELRHRDEGTEWKTYRLSFVLHGGRIVDIDESGDRAQTHELAIWAASHIGVKPSVVPAA